jgi:aspartate carbamoyltransferase regulatory subunit
MEVELKVGTYIAFIWPFGDDIVISDILNIRNDEMLVCFMYGLRSESEWVKRKDIVAIGDSSATGKIKGWRGNFNIIQPNHKIFNER